jgi:hypothetical protein
VSRTRKQRCASFGHFASGAFSLKRFHLTPNHGFYGTQQPVAAGGEPSGIDDLVVRPDTPLSDRRKTRIPCDERLPWK